MRPAGDFSRQGGASIIVAVFVLVVLSFLGAAMFNLLAAGNDSVAREILSTRALFAAESGAQRRLNEVFIGAAACGACSAGGTFTDYGGGGNWYDSCTASVSCCSYSPGNGVTYYELSSTGSCGPAADRAVRTVEVQARD